MLSYLKMVEEVLNHGEWKENRTGIRTKTIFGGVFRHDMSKGFPLLTTKKMAFKTMCVELEGFIGGITDKIWYQDRGCKIWNEWSNPTNDDGCDLGPIYGYQWRRFNQEYVYPVNSRRQPLMEMPIDQLAGVVKTLEDNPNDRRMVVSSWNPLQINQMALPPCHWGFGLVHINGTLNLSWHQRSCDLFLGVPFNISSYGLLLELLCAGSGLKPGVLLGVLDDLHIYENQISVAEEQLEREPKRLPTIKLPEGTIFNWTHKDIELCNYECHPPLKVEVAV